MHHGFRCLARGHILGPGRKFSQFRIPALGQFARKSSFQFSGQGRICPPVVGQRILPGVLVLSPVGNRPAEKFRDLAGNIKCLLRGPGAGFFGAVELLFPQGRAVRIAQTLFVWGAVADRGPHANERRFFLFFFGFFNGPVDSGHIVSVFDLLHLPAVSLEAHLDVLGKSKSCGTGQRDPVVVIQDDELSQAQMPRQRAGFRCQPFHQISVAGHYIRIMIDDLLTLAIETGSQVRFGNGHADTVGQSLAQWAGGDFRARHMPVLGVPRRPASPLAEIFNVVQR